MTVDVHLAVPAANGLGMRNVLYLWSLANPAQKRLVGTLRLLAATGTQANGVSLTYAPGWLTNGFALSEDLPLQPGERIPTERDSAVGAVDDARPDHWGERVSRHLLNQPRLSTLDYLFYAGDERFGALGVSLDSEHYLPFETNALPTIDDVPAIFRLVRAIENRQPIAQHQMRLIAPGATLGGARPKALVAFGKRAWVIKFAEHGDTLDSPAVEHAAMTLARRVGINSCDTRLLSFTQAQQKCHALLVKRFDRVGVKRRHALSARVALNAEGLYELAPAFDVLPSGLGLGYQQFRVGNRGAEFSVENACSEASAFRLTRPKARAIAAQIAQIVGGWQLHFKRVGVVPKDIAQLSRTIDGPRLLTQRSALLKT